MRQCHNCHRYGHLQHQCPNSSSPRSVRENTSTYASPQNSSSQRRQAQQSLSGYERQSWPPRQQGQSRQQFSSKQYGQASQRQAQHQPGPGQQQLRRRLKCFLCDRTGHLARDCLTRAKIAAMIRDESERKKPLKENEREVKAAACQPRTSRAPTERRMPPLSCRQHKRIHCPQCLELPTSTHDCQALIAVCQKCGLHHSVVADACLLQNKAQQMPVAVGTVEGKPVSVMRDTGCSTVVVRRSLVSDEKLTDQKEDDGAVCHAPAARIFVRTPYFIEIVMALCMEDPMCDLIIGNIQGAVDLETSQQETQAELDKFQYRYRTNRPSQRTISKGRSRRSRGNRRQQNLNLREPSSKSAAVRPKLKLLPRTVKDR